LNPEVRGFMTGVAAVTGLAALSQVARGDRGGGAAPRSGDYPFRLGIASGDPTPQGVVLWTRLVPEPFSPDGGMPTRRVPVDWQVALDETMRVIVQEGTLSALPELAHSVRVEVDGLLPGREYSYRFRYRGDVTEIGRTRTAPEENGLLGSLSFAFASCQDWSHGFYSAYRSTAEEDLDLVIHLGDYVYEYGVPADGGLRRTPTPDLQRTQARFPWLVTWDDHEMSTTTSAPTTARSTRTAPRPTARGTSTSRYAVARCRAGTARSTPTGGRSGAAWPSSTCSTPGSTARHRPAGGARHPPVRPGTTRPRARCWARSRRSCCSTASGARTPGGTSSRPA
jgi:phosphodiesterase/alkaline phosphatase D-like protein